MLLISVPFCIYHTSTHVRVVFFSFSLFSKVGGKGKNKCILSFRLEERRQCTKTGD